MILSWSENLEGSAESISMVPAAMATAMLMPGSVSPDCARKMLAVEWPASICHFALCAETLATASTARLNRSGNCDADFIRTSDSIFLNLIVRPWPLLDTPKLGAELAGPRLLLFLVRLCDRSQKVSLRRFPRKARLQRGHQIDDVLSFHARHYRQLLPPPFCFDQPLQLLPVGVNVLARFKRRGQRIDQLHGQLRFRVLELGFLWFFPGGPNLIFVEHRVKREAAFERANDDNIFATEHRHFGNSGISGLPHRIEQQIIGSHATLIRLGVIRAFEVDRINLLALYKTQDFHRSRRLGFDLFELLFREQEILTLLVLVAFNYLRAIHELFARGTIGRLLDAAAARRVNLIEADSFGPRRRFERNRNRDKSESKETLPRSSHLCASKDGHHSSEQTQQKAISYKKRRLSISSLHRPCRAIPIAWRNRSPQRPLITGDLTIGGDNPVQVSIRKCDCNAEHTHQDPPWEALRPILYSMACHRRGASLVACRADPSGRTVDRPAHNRGAHPAPLAGLDSPHAVSRTLQIHSAHPNLCRSPTRCNRR